MVPAPITSYKNLSMQRDDGIMTVHCMSTKDYLKFYGDDKYWNLDLKADFMTQTRNLWKGLSEKDSGRLFHTKLGPNDEDKITLMKVDREMQEAIAKHGEVKVPKKYEDLFFEKV
jgi:hypothetical protein